MTDATGTLHTWASMQAVNEVGAANRTGPGRSAHRTDDELIGAFEAASLTADSFGHADHVRVAWIYLRRHSLLETIARYGAGLRRLASALGKPDQYHETVTWALLILIHQRVRRRGSARTWSEFAAAEADLLRWEDGPLFDYYDREILDSAEAREMFILPRRRADRRDGGAVPA